MLRCRGVTLVELLVALVLATVVLTVATGSALRQQRTHAHILAVSDVDAQLHAAMLVLSNQLATLDAGAGDITAGEALDSALQFRAPIATSIACRSAPGSTTLHPDSSTATPLGGATSAVRTGDSLWWLGDSTWTGRRIAAVSSVSSVSAVCPLPSRAGGPALHLDISSPDTIPPNTPLRITRPTRYSLYRSSGSWQLGFREWNDPSAQLTAPQPVAGPLLLTIGSRRSGFRYFDTNGVELLPTSAPIDVSQIARIRLTTHMIVAEHDLTRDSIRTDSVDVAVGHGTGP
jgi:prepilin-type N-terminal cleavage/methylation domain-containing protein